VNEETQQMGFALIILFSIAQGAAIFGTAYLALRLLKTAHRFSKVAAMSVSYAAWVALTIAGYTLLGGEGGLMDGFGLVIFLCLTALISSLVYLLMWMLRPASGA
jgi:hypothetical protein